MLIAFSQDERRSDVAHGLRNFIADRSIPGLVIDQELVERLELHALVRPCIARRVKRSRADKDCVLEAVR